MNYRSAAALLLALTSLVPARAGDLAPTELSDEHVDAAIEAMVEELYRRKHPSRFWEPADGRNGQTATQGGGLTALAVLALVHAGESYQDPRLIDAIQYLADYEMQGTYAVATRAHVWAKLPAKFEDKLEHDARWLMNAYSEKGPGWDYESEPTSSRKDNSLRQYGVLGLWEAAKRGVRVPDAFWRQIEDTFVDCQLPDGGWNYRADAEPPRGSMTAAGLTVLSITQDLLHGSVYLDAGAKPPSRPHAAMTRGFAWMEKNFSATTHPGTGRDFFYYLYGVERVGLASGRKDFGGRDWYRDGTAAILDELCAWDADAKTLTLAKTVTGKAKTDDLIVRRLAFAVLYLSKGRVSIAFNKLDVPGLAWNNRPRDVANLTEWMSGLIEPAVGWQVVSLDTAPETWFDAPALYLASNEALPWAGAETGPAQKLKRYIDLGGLLLAVNEGRGRHFDKSIETLGKRMYPQYAWRTLPKDHWAYTVHQPLRGKPPLRGLSNGVRELIILSPTDLSRSYQARDEKKLRDFQVASNVFMYASEMTRRLPRLQPAASSTSSGVTAAARIVRAQHAGNWNPEPLALEVAGADLWARRGITLGVSDHPLASIHEIDPPPPLVTICGTVDDTLDTAALDAIAAYVGRGGVVLVETPGGRGTFTETAETAIAARLGLAVEGINGSHIVTGRDLPGAAPLGRVGYRAFALQSFGARETAPRLRGLRVDGVVRVVFSREDLSHAWLDRPCWGVLGYGTSSARDLLGNLTLHAADVAVSRSGTGSP